MSDYTRKHPGRECPPHPEDPADQPTPPNGECEKLPESEEPVPPPPEECPPTKCKCPKPPGTSSNCLEDLIGKQATDMGKAANAEKFKKELEVLLDAAKKGAAKYTRSKYEDLVDEWVKQDAYIAEFLRKLVCAVPCWKCVLECYVCPILNEMHMAEQWLYDAGKLPTQVFTLYDLQYWRSRDKLAKQKVATRIENILKAWQDPAGTIEKHLAANKTLAEAASKLIGTEPGKALYDVFFRLVPLHLAIAPPAGDDTTTMIDKKFTIFCECDKGTPVHCCGLDVGEWSLRQRLVGPQPFLIDPNSYFKLICCLVEHRLIPAREAAADAEAKLTSVTNDITRYEKLLADNLNPENFEKRAEAAIPGVIDCCDYEKNGDDGPCDEDEPPKYGGGSKYEGGPRSYRGR